MNEVEQLTREYAVGTAFMTYVLMPYYRLVELFGEPESGPTSDGKVQAEWVLDTPEGIVTIYDWKEEKRPEYVTEWHIGAKNWEAADWMADYIRNNLESD